MNERRMCESCARTSLWGFLAMVGYEVWFDARRGTDRDVQSIDPIEFAFLTP